MNFLNGLWNDNRLIINDSRTKGLFNR